MLSLLCTRLALSSAVWNRDPSLVSLARCASGWSLSAMKAIRIISITLAAACSLTPLAWSQPTVAMSARAPQGPAVHKTEPPNWWVHYTPDLTLLLTGENLFGARAMSASTAGAISSFASSTRPALARASAFPYCP